MSLHYKDRSKFKKSPMNRVNENRTERNRTNSSKPAKLTASILGIIAVLIFYAIFHTNANYYLFSWDINNLNWSKVSSRV